MRALIVLSVIIVASGALLTAGSASAKERLRARVEVSGGGLPSSIVMEGTVSLKSVFLHDDVATTPPENAEPAYTVKLMPEGPGDEAEPYPVLTLTYFPASGDTQALLRGEWDSADRYFKASASFQAALDEAIGAEIRDEGGPPWVAYAAPGLAAAGVVLIGGLAGLKRRRRLRR